MSGFEKIEEQMRLRTQFEDETGCHWENSQREPDIDYVIWLEAKVIELATIAKDEPNGNAVSEDEPYCTDCSSNKLNYRGQYANGEHYQCRECGKEFMWTPTTEEQ